MFYLFSSSNDFESRNRIQFSSRCMCPFSSLIALSECKDTESNLRDGQSLLEKKRKMKEHNGPFTSIYADFIPGS